MKPTPLLRRLLLATALLAGLLGVARPAHAAEPIIHRVDRDAPGPAHDGASWETAYTTLQDALDHSASGHEIWVAAGVYTPTLGGVDPRTATFQLINGVGMYGGFAGGESLRSQRNWSANETILSGDIGATGVVTDNAYHVVTSECLTQTTVLDGLTITAGQADWAGGGMYNWNGSNPTLVNVAFSGNSAVNVGGGMYNYTDSCPVLVNVTFTGNSAGTLGGGMANSLRSNSTLANVVFSGNSAGTSGGGMAVMLASNPTLVNVTFAGNRAGTSGGAISSDSSSLAVCNSILWGNTPDQLDDGGLSHLVSFSIVQGGYPGAIDADPRFVRAPGPGPDSTWGTADDDYGDLRLQAPSPAIDAGSNLLVPPDALDLDGNGDRTKPLPLDLAGNPRFVDHLCSDTGVGTPPIVDMGAYEVPPAPVPGVLYVDADAVAPAHDGVSWATAFTDLQDALRWATHGVEVWVAAGTYKPTTGADRSASFHLNERVAIYGGFAGTESARSQRDWRANETVLSGDIGAADVSTDNSYHVVVSGGVAATAVLDGFTIGDGYASGSWPDSSGGGMFNSHSSPTLANVTFRDNWAAGGGGGMYNHLGSPALAGVTFLRNSAARGGGVYGDTGAPTLRGVAFLGNSAEEGGGMYDIWGSPDLADVVFCGNLATNGAGVFNATSTPRLANVTFVANLATGGGGGMYNVESSPAIANCIFWRDLPGEIFMGTGSTPAVNYSDVSGGYKGTGNIDADPVFLREPSPGLDETWGTPDDDYGDLRLGPASPAIDAGDNDAVPGDVTTDLAGMPRLADCPRPDTGHGTPPIVDMGAYEAQPPALSRVFLPLVLR